jgi:tetratricopeptide (TPR) repeat protein
MRSVRACFSGHALSQARKREIAGALSAVRVDAYPPLTRLSARDKVRLEALSALNEGAAHKTRARRLWEQFRARLMARMVAAIGVAGSLATLSVVFGLLGGNQPGQADQTKMAGDLNIAIAPFTSYGLPTRDGLEFARITSEILQSEIPQLDQALSIEIRGPQSVGPLAGRSAAAQAKSARALASQIGADIVVYGEVRVSPQMTSVQPGFYLNTEKLPSASGLAGEYRYGDEISEPYSIDVNPQTRAEIRDQLIRRTDAYAAVFIGVGYYLKHELRQAARYLRRALESSPNGSTASLLKLLLGNVADQSGDRSGSRHYYTAASRDPATRARAEFWLGEVSYETARGSCGIGRVNRSGLWMARADFAKVLHTAGISEAEAADPSLAAKIQFGLGQTDLCLSASRTTNRWHSAQAEFAAVVHAYRVQLADLRDDTAEAHAGIGLCELTLEEAPRAYEDARTEYTAAAALTTIASRRAYFESVVAFANRQLKGYAAATRTYQHERSQRLARKPGLEANGHLEGPTSVR